ncbi:MAG: Fur family transcriptional regulator [Mariprofundales bacterium]|nr:Fur family transcriptional regulator [Mariprofundales bacterium]
MKLTQQRTAILQLVTNSDHHWDAEAIVVALNNQGRKIGNATVYRGLQALEQAGMLTSLPINGRKHYELGGKQHHDHLICTACGQIKEFCHPEIERLQLEMAAQNAFVVHDHQLVLYGTCQACTAKSNRAQA